MTDRPLREVVADRLCGIAGVKPDSVRSIGARGRVTWGDAMLPEADAIIAAVREHDALDRDRTARSEQVNAVEVRWRETAL